MKIEESLLKKNSKMIFYRKVMARCWKRLPFRRTIRVEKGWHSPRAAPPNSFQPLFVLLYPPSLSPLRAPKISIVPLTIIIFKV